MDDLIYKNIAKNLSGEATASEKEMLQQWLAADPDNAVAYEDMKLFWQGTDAVFKAPAFDTGRAWEKVSAKMEYEKPVSGRSIPFRPWVRYSIAAAAVLLLGIFAVNNFLINKTITVAATDKNMEIMLPDNSHITLRKGSVLHYPKTFADNERNVQLEGEAFFEVARNEKKPFIIDAQSATVKVLGTSFNVKCSEAQASVIVRTGKVQMADRKTTAAVILTPGERGYLKEGKLTEENVGLDNLLYWKTGAMNFSEQTLSEIISELSQLKDTAILFDSNVTEDHKQQLINISFKEQSLDEMMTDLCLVAQCQWTKQNNTYLVSGR